MCIRDRRNCEIVKLLWLDKLLEAFSILPVFSSLADMCIGTWSEKLTLGMWCSDEFISFWHRDTHTHTHTHTRQNLYILAMRAVTSKKQPPEAVGAAATQSVVCCRRWTLEDEDRRSSQSLAAGRLWCQNTSSRSSAVVRQADFEDRQDAQWPAPATTPDLLNCLSQKAVKHEN